VSCKPPLKKTVAQGSDFVASKKMKDNPRFFFTLAHQSATAAGTSNERRTIRTPLAAFFNGPKWELTFYHIGQFPLLKQSYIKFFQFLPK